MKHLIIALSSLIFSLQCFAASDADNTEVNERDRTTTAVTADQQNQNSSDLTLTQRIRQHIMKDKDFSTYAQNVKIITVNGLVTLKGPVRSLDEQTRIIKHARMVVNDSNIKNEMSVVSETK